MEQRLREKIENMLGRKMTVPRDFVWLSEKLQEASVIYSSIMSLPISITGSMETRIAVLT